jgi:hypothetical protein
MPGACNVTGNPIDGLKHTNNFLAPVVLFKDTLDHIRLHLQLCSPIVFGVTFNKGQPNQRDHSVIVYGYSNVSRGPDGSIVDADLLIWDPAPIIDKGGNITLKYSVFPSGLEQESDVICDFTVYTKTAS